MKRLAAIFQDSNLLNTYKILHVLDYRIFRVFLLRGIAPGILRPYLHPTFAYRMLPTLGGHLSTLVLKLILWCQFCLSCHSLDENEKVKMFKGLFKKYVHSKGGKQGKGSYPERTSNVLLCHFYRLSLNKGEGDLQMPNLERTYFLNGSKVVAIDR